MTTSTKFWDKIAEKYANSPITHEDEYQKKLTITQSYFTPDMDVLEFGCGTGSTAIVHAPHVKSYTAIDISENMIQIAERKRQQKQLTMLSFKKATLDDYASQQSSYDAVLGLSILHLLPDPEQAIQTAYHMLKPGGVFVTNTACLQNTMAFLKYLLPIPRWLGFVPYVHFMSRNALEGYLIKAGFELEYKWVPEKGKHVYFIVARKR